MPASSPRVSPAPVNASTIPRIVSHGLPELSDAGLAGPGPEVELSTESQAALRQLPLQRIMGYGVEYGDAVRVRTAVASGNSWKCACVAVAQSVLDRLAMQEVPSSPRTRSDRAYRASALLRISQLMTLHDDEERRATYCRAADLFEGAMQYSGGWSRSLVSYGGSQLVGWFLPAPAEAVSRVVVVLGGIEGWAMDFEVAGRMLARRGLGVFLLDGPGQGESRLRFNTYLTSDWRGAFSRVLDYLQDQRGARSIGILGNSMGGNFAIQFATSDARIAACCNNGAIRVPLSQKQRANFYPKMAAFCDRAAPGRSEDVWDGLEITAGSVTSTAPFLVVHGESDPLVSMSDAEQVLNWSAAADKQMHIFNKGDHCVYDKPADKHDLISDWFASRL